MLRGRVLKSVLCVQVLGTVICVHQPFHSNYLHNGDYEQHCLLLSSYVTVIFTMILHNYMIYPLYLQELHPFILVIYTKFTEFLHSIQLISLIFNSFEGSGLRLR